MDNRILHNPRCSKSRQTLALLQDKGLSLPVVEYLKTPLSEKELGQICKLLGLRPYELVRRKEALFAELKLAAVKPDDDRQWLAVLARHPALLERPIVIVNGKAALGRPPENVLNIL